MIADNEYVIKKSMDFHGYPYTVLCRGKDPYTMEPRSTYENDEYEILTRAEFNKKVEAFCGEFCGNWKETSEQRYNDMLDVLPPLKWTNGGFYVSEAYTLDIYPFHQKYDGRYYEAYFRLSAPRNEILESLEAFVKSRNNQEEAAA